MQVYPIQGHSWVAIDHIDDYRENFQLQSQSLGSKACRQLLKTLQHQLNLSAELIETDFPYFFKTPNNDKWYVSFSHSRCHVAVLISHHAYIGIDIEDNAISHQVASRFFSNNESAWLNNQPQSEQTRFRKLLWQLKECHIKTYQDAHHKLIKQLKSDILADIGEAALVELLPDNSIDNELNTINLINFQQRIIGNMTALPCSFVIVNA